MYIAFDSAKQLIDEAKSHMPVISDMIGAFLHIDNGVHTIHTDPVTAEGVMKVIFKTEMDKRLPLRTFDVAGYLRSALDQACYASALIIKGGNPTKTKFLFADTESGLRDDVRRGKCKDMHPRIIDLICALEPYKGGNTRLWGLNKLRNSYVHRILEPTTAKGIGIHMNSGTLRGSFTPCQEWNPSERELIWGRLSRDSYINAMAAPMLRVSFANDFEFPDQSATASLKKLVEETEQIVMSIEAETDSIVNSRRGPAFT
ncbi:hypothetical protein [Sinorhizobium meliloti]|uniref:hypothetical protein n=1 Tax=Rhizobium meliloti TaxID=382 RepID=UPI000FD7C267|nr:hypothetical protein [Sinorhizobium meliloti]RVG83687.1 hypothetical protein CN218_33860 [Sinorhizobium meliloti]